MGSWVSCRLNHGDQDREAIAHNPSDDHNRRDPGKDRRAPRLVFNSGLVVCAHAPDSTMGHSTCYTTGMARARLLTGATMDFFSDNPGDPGGQNSGNDSGCGSLLGFLLFVIVVAILAQVFF